MKRLTVKSIQSKIAKDKKNQASPKDIARVIDLLSDLTYNYPQSVYSLLFVNGIRRAKRRGKR